MSEKAEHVGDVALIAPMQFSGLDKLVKALNKVMDDCGYVQKGGRNPEFGYTFASDSDILSVVRPSMAKNGLALFPTTSDCKVVEHGESKKGTMMWRAELTQGFRLAHSSGQFIDLQAAGCGLDSQDKSVPKAQTSAQKYLLKLLVMFATGDDPEYVSPAEKTEEKEKAQAERSTQHRERMANAIADAPLDNLESVLRKVAGELATLGAQMLPEHRDEVKAIGAQRKKELKK